MSEEQEPQSPPDEEEIPRAVRQRIEALIPEIVRKTLSSGMSAVYSSAKEMKMPKEVAGYIAETAGATKDEVFRVVATEVREFLESANLSEEIAKILTMLSFEIKTEIRFIPNDEKFGGIQPDVKAKARVRAKRPSDWFRRRRTTEEQAAQPDPDAAKTEED